MKYIMLKSYLGKFKKKCNFQPIFVSAILNREKAYNNNRSIDKCLYNTILLIKNTTFEFIL